ncbi:MAG: RBBP9/YdeN family alpha/beta hydrolase [Candidatus Dojkabacteria bacterium]
MKTSDQKTLLILHGINGQAGNFWQQWLAKELSESVRIIMPNLPNPKNPDRQEWIAAIKNETAGEDLSGLVVVGHSLGVPAGLDFVETLNPNQRILGFISVAGFYKPYGLELNEEYLAAKTIDIIKVRKAIQNRAVIRSKNDPYVSQEALGELARGLQANDYVIRDGKHFQHGKYISTFPLVKFLVEQM